MIVKELNQRGQSRPQFSKDYGPTRPLALFTESMVALLSSTTTHSAFVDLVSLMGQTFPLAAPSVYVLQETGAAKVYSVLERDQGGRDDAVRVLGTKQFSYVRLQIGGHPPMLKERLDLTLMGSSQVRVIVSINSGIHDEIFREWVKLLAPAVAKMMDNEQLRDLAFRDALTGVMNYRAFREMVQAECDRCCRYNTTFSLIMLDIDWFKRINDRFGHQMGDSVLRDVAVRLLQCVRKSDLVFRYGGEEFAILMPHTDLEKALNLAERIRRAVERMRFGGDTGITVSLGVSQYEDGLAPHDLVKRSDRGLYLAKEKGRNRTETLHRDGK